MPAERSAELGRLKHGYLSSPEEIIDEARNGRSMPVYVKPCLEPARLHKVPSQKDRYLSFPRLGSCCGL